MEEKIYQNNCGEDDVLAFNTTMLKVDKLREEVEKLFDERKLGEQLTNSFSSQNLPINVPGESYGRRDYRRCYENWLGDGMDCEILKLGAKGWQKGKVKIKLNVSLEFYSDEVASEETQASGKSESTLDDLRQMITEDSSQQYS